MVLVQMLTAIQVLLHLMNLKLLPGDINDDVIIGDYINENEDEDDSDPAGIDIFDLALRKTIVSVAPTFDYSQTIDFLLEIFNQGNLDAKNITIEEEAIPCGFQFDLAANPGWIYDPVLRMRDILILTLLHQAT